MTDTPDPAGRNDDPAARRQEQAVERSPGAPDPYQTVIDERTADTNTQSSGGLGGGAPSGRPGRTTERKDLERDEFPRDPALPADDATLKTKM
jgi:hypothetical protein